MIPFLDLKKSYQNLQSEINEKVQYVLNSGSYIGGEVVNQFETNWASYCESKYAVGVGNGYDALVLSLLSLEIGPGDEVLVPAHTFFATWAAVSNVGATPVAVDVCSDTYNIDPLRINQSITSRTKAIIAVHLYGQAADLEEILNICHKKKIFLIEDAAQSHGAKYKGKKIGSHGDLVCWSFYPGKNLGAFGDAGAVTTNSNHLANKVRKLSNYGSNVRYEHDLIGQNSRLDPLQAAILIVKLDYLDSWNKKRQKIASVYLDSLKNIQIELPVIRFDAEHVWHLFVLKVKDRIDFQNHMEIASIKTLVHYPKLPCQQSSYKMTKTNFNEIPNSVELVNHIISIPIGPHQSDKDTNIIIETIKLYFSKSTI